MSENSDAKVWVLIALIALVTVVMVAGFVWYLDSVGSADGPDEGMASATRLLGMVS